MEFSSRSVQFDSEWIWFSLFHIIACPYMNMQAYAHFVCLILFDYMLENICRRDFLRLISHFNSNQFVFFICRRLEMKDDSAIQSCNGFGDEESFSFMCSSLDVVQHDETSQANFFLEKLMQFRTVYQNMCHQYVDEIETTEKKHQDDKNQLQAEIHIKMTELQDELAKRTNELTNMTVEKLAQKTFNGKFQQFLRSIHERKYYFYAKFSRSVKYSNRSLIAIVS